MDVTATKLQNGVRTAVAATLLTAGTAMAQDYSAITEAADWAAVATGVVTIFAALALVLVALKGGRKLLSAIGR